MRAGAVGGLDDYGNSMFRFEQLHLKWIDSCARYLRQLFGDRLKGKVFLDYGFGRGNWSLAALKAGAARVIAIDAAAGNVARFSDYCRAQAVVGVEVVHGNILEKPVGGHADVLWVYGVLSQIPNPDLFVEKIFQMRRDDDAVALIYAYDHGSLRQVIVNAARMGVTYDNEQSFAGDSYLFTPRARLRARDDLTAPLICWYSAPKLTALIGRHGAHIDAQCPGFVDWLNNSSSEEFAPYHLLCGFRNAPDGAAMEPVRSQAGDFAVLEAMSTTVMDRAPPALRRALAIGLYNTHFSALPANGTAGIAVIEDFLFLMHAALRLNMSVDDFGGLALPYYAAAIAAMRDAPRGLPNDLMARSELAAFLDRNTVRV